jgi:hypothetical protein
MRWLCLDLYLDLALLAVREESITVVTICLDVSAWVVEWVRKLLEASMSKMKKKQTNLRSQGNSLSIPFHHNPIPSPIVPTTSNPVSQTTSTHSPHHPPPSLLVSTPHSLPPLAALVYQQQEARIIAR